MQLVFASNNPNKIKEIQQLLPKNIQILSLEDIGCYEEIPETAQTIEGNAILKANYVSEKYGYDCFADDTGLEVDALNGAPGVYSARYAGAQKSAEDNMDKLLEALTDISNRKAQFKTVIALNKDKSCVRKVVFNCDTSMVLLLYTSRGGASPQQPVHWTKVLCLRHM